MAKMRAATLFLYDFANPDAYLAAERIVHELPAVPEWVPVLGSSLPAGLPGGWRHPGDLLVRTRVERDATGLGLQPIRWPDPFPLDSDLALRVATYAKGIGKVVAFSLAAFRQAFAGGRDLAAEESVLIAAAACEMHPTAVLKGAAMRSVADRLRDATEEAARRGVTHLPALVVEDRVFCGERIVEDAAAVMATGAR
jgi:2-hydroxychromene-2-carboxylate isomerase